MSQRILLFICLMGTSGLLTEQEPAQPPPAPAQPSSAPSDDQPSWISQLQNLALLHDQGVLSDTDYEAAKRRVLEQK